MDDKAILLADLRAGNSQGAWDWPADLRFAIAIGDKEAIDDIQRAMKSNAPWSLLLAAYKGLVDARITQRRLRALRALIRDGLVRGYWSGTGWGGVAYFGGCYELTEVQDAGF